MKRRVIIVGIISLILLTACSIVSPYLDVIQEKIYDDNNPDPSYLSPNIGKLVYVPSGSFQRDSGTENISVVTTPFRMSEYEITRAQFDAIMGTDPSDTSKSSGTSDPVQRVNWYHAITFCNKLSIREGLEPVYSVANIDFYTLGFSSIPTSSNSTWDALIVDWSVDGYRLPTEMEWMWAAMGAVDDYTKPFAGSNGSNVIGDYAVFGYYSDDEGRTMTERSNPVGSKLPNELGLYDISGNIFEWVWDRYDNGDSYSDPIGTIYSDTLAGKGPTTGNSRILRGGFWGSSSGDCTVVNRFTSGPAGDDYLSLLGFRVVRP